MQDKVPKMERVYTEFVNANRRQKYKQARASQLSVLMRVLLAIYRLNTQGELEKVFCVKDFWQQSYSEI